MGVPPSVRWTVLSSLASYAQLVACGGATPRSSTPRPPELVEMEEMRITARPREGGGFDMESYDAETLFVRGTEELNRRQCASAVQFYDRLADEFPASRYRSPALYNAGLCLQDGGDREQAAVRYDRLVREHPASPDVKHATFQLAHLYVDLEAWDEAIQAAEALLAREDLSTDERVEAMARRAQALLGAEKLDEAVRQAKTAVTYVRGRPEDDQVRDNFFIGAANFVWAETIRRRAEAIEVPVAAVDQQRAALERRAQLLLDAQREYFNTIRWTHAHWAAASGYRIGAMYTELWRAITDAPIPPPSKRLPPNTQGVYEQEYRQELSRTIRPLIRNAIRYWELTLMMVERTGTQSEWTEKLGQDLEVARERLLTESATSEN